MSEIKKAHLVPSQLQRSALTAAPHTGLTLPGHILTSSIITSSGAPLTKSVGSGCDRISVDSIARTVRKQSNPVKQTVVVLSSSTNSPTVSTANLAPRTTKFTAPLPPPLIPAILSQPPASSTTAAASTVSGRGAKNERVKPTLQPPPAKTVAAPTAHKTLISKPTLTPNGATSATPTQTKKPETTAPLSDSSSEDSSSDTSGTSEESDKDESLNNNSLPNKPSAGTVVIDSEVPGPSGFAKRGRGRPRHATSTPKLVKQVKPGGQRARTTPRKKSERVPKPPVIFSPDTAAGKAALPKRRGRGCGGCPGCTREDCGKCNYCKDKTKFGGPGRKKQRCALRVCSNFVKPPHGKGRPVQPGTPPGEVAIIPVSKLASSLKVAEVIEQLRQNLTSSIPPVIDKDSVFPSLSSTTAAAPNTTSFIIAQPQQLKATSSALTSIAASETKIVGPVAPSTMISKVTSTATPAVSTAPVMTSAAVSSPAVSKTAATAKQTQPKTSEAPKTTPEAEKKEVKTTAVEKAPDSSKSSSEVSKPSEIALRTRRKQQQQQQPQQQVKEMLGAPTSSANSPASGDQDKIKCIVCGRGRKPSLMRSNQFCTQRCINAWSEKNKGAEPATSSLSPSRRLVVEVETPMEVEKQQTVTQQQKKMPRALKILQIDMTWDKRSSPGTRAPPSYTPTASATPKPTMTSTPTATTATNKRPTSSTGVQPPAAKKLTKELEIAVGTKRPSQQQPPQNQKRMKEAEPAKSVSFNLTPIPTSTVDPIAAPPLSRTVPPPSISIVPLDQLTALGTALLSHQQHRARKDEALAVTAAAKSVASGRQIPAGLPVDVRSWTINEVVKFFESTTDCKDYAAVFKEQEVDGTALLLLTHESLVKCLGIKLGRALKIMVHVEELQKLYA